MNFLKENRFKALFLCFLILIAILVFYQYINKSNQISDAELLKLKTDCSNLAKSFIQEKKLDFVFESNWSILHSDYNIKRRSCFAEFDVNVLRPNDEFNEYRIYDILTKNEITSLTWYQKNMDSEWSKYYTESSSEYYDLRKEIFGIKRDEI